MVQAILGTLQVLSSVKRPRLTSNVIGMAKDLLDQLGSVHGRYRSFPELFMGGAGFTGSSTWM
eukprot:315384-Pyramimonas_sp.AAC.1